MLGCGEVVKTIIDADYSDKTPKGVEFDPVWINNFLGADIPEDVMRNCLEKLDFRIENGKAYAPSVRIDIECKADIAEEVARIYGYNNIPKTIIRGVADAKLTEKQKLERKTANAMTALGAYEITTYSFISPKYFDKIRLPMDSTLRKTVVISNPLGEDTSVMRTTLLPSMCEVMARNYNNRNAAVCLFELGSEYIPNGGELPDEPVRLSVGAYGGDMDFYGIKGIVDSMLKNIGVEDFEYSAEMNGFGEAEAFHPGRRAVITKDGKAIGILGELHPETLENYGIGVKAYAAKVNVTELLDIANAVKTYKPLPKFPAAVRDLAIVCDENLPVAELEKAIKRAVGNTLESVTLFDVYKGKQIAEGKKSVAYSIAMRSHEGTLTDEQSDAAVKRVLKELEKLGAELRA